VGAEVTVQNKRRLAATAQCATRARPAKNFKFSEISGLESLRKRQEIKT
jgi:hypothetical protein